MSSRMCLSQVRSAWRPASSARMRLALVKRTLAPWRTICWPRACATCEFPTPTGPNRMTVSPGYWVVWVSQRCSAVWMWSGRVLRWSMASRSPGMGVTPAVVSAAWWHHRMIGAVPVAAMDRSHSRAAASGSMA